MQKQQNLDYFSPQALALWAAIASLGVMSPAHAEPRSEGSHSDPLVPTATQVVVPALPVEDVAPTAAPASQTPAPQSENLAQSSTQAVTSPVAQAQEAPQDSNLPQLYAQQQGNPNAQQANPNEPRVLVAEIQINGVGDNVELEQRIIRAIETQAGRPTTVSQIRNDVNRVYATGLFANVVATPEDTPLGVRVTFDVVPNPV